MIAWSLILLLPSDLQVNGIQARKPGSTPITSVDQFSIGNISVRNIKALQYFLHDLKCNSIQQERMSCCFRNNFHGCILNLPTCPLNIDCRLPSN